MSTPPVYLVVGDRHYGGWTSARITRGIESICGSFSLDLVDRWAAQDQPWPIFEGDACSIVVGKELLITGAVDRRELEFDATSHRVSVEGRDAARNLVDCAARLSVWEFENVHPVEFVRKLAKQYGVNVTLQPGISPASIALSKRHTIHPGETSGNAIATVCQVAGLLPVSDGAGGISLVRASTERVNTAIVEGENLLGGRVTLDIADRFREVFVLGSHAGTDQDWGTPITSIQGSAVDPNVEQGRVTFIRPEVTLTGAQARERAQWEVAVRAARGSTVSVRVQGWQMADGKLWPINRLVRLRSPLLEVDADLLITQATYTISREVGSLTQLELRSPNAFLPAPIAKDESALWSELRGGV